MDQDYHMTPRDVLPIAFAGSVFVFHALLFGRWIVDDGGISFAYARNFAGGYGLVSQPGAVPVEGYSNPLWVFLMAPFFAIGVFHPVLTPKIVATLLAILSFAVIDRSVCALSGGRRSVSFVALVLLGLNTPYVAWSISGLENALYVFLLSSMLALFVVPVEPPRREPIWFALLALCVALTRPDGIAYAGVYPLVAAIRGATDGEPWRKTARRLGIYSRLFATMGTTLLFFRLLYFHDFVPNTYYAKGGADVRNLLIAGRLSALVEGATAFGGNVVLLCLASATAFLALRQRIGWQHVTSLIFLCASISVFLLLPSDWMGEFRFGSPFFAFFLANAVVTVRLSLEAIEWSPRWRERIWNLAAAGAIVASAALGATRSLAFAGNPPAPFSAVEERTWQFERYARDLGIDGGSILTPDVGAALYFSRRLRIIDLAMLCDRTIARTLRNDPRAFHEYVFGVVKPTFIHTHDFWTPLARFDDDPRFRRDYVAIREWTGDLWVPDDSGKRMLDSGDYVRRDALRRHQLR